MTTLLAPTASGYLPGTQEYRKVVAALFAAGLATFALLYSTQALLPALVREFGVSTAESTLTMSVTTLGLGLALLVAGAWSDRVGRTRLIHASLAASGVVALACALAPSWPALVALRLLQGVALAGLPAVATAYLREELDHSAQARAAGVYIGGTALGGMTGRLLTGFVGEAAGWRWAVAATAALALGCALAVHQLLPSSRHFTARPAGSWLAATRDALVDRGLVTLYLVGGCAAGALVAVFNALGFRLAAAPFDLELGAASLVFLVYPVGTASSIVFGRLADGLGRRAVLPIGCALAIVGVLLTLPTQLPLVIVGLALLIAGFFAVHGVASGWVPARAHAAGVSTAQAASLYLFTYYLGSSVFGSLTGHAWETDGWPGVVVLSTGLLVVASVLALALRRTPALLTSSPTGASRPGSSLVEKAPASFLGRPSLLTSSPPSSGAAPS